MNKIFYSIILIFLVFYPLCIYGAPAVIDDKGKYVLESNINIGDSFISCVIKENFSINSSTSMGMKTEINNKKDNYSKTLELFDNNILKATGKVNTKLVNNPDGTKTIIKDKEFKDSEGNITKISETCEYDRNGKIKGKTVVTTLPDGKISRKEKKKLEKWEYPDLSTATFPVDFAVDSGMAFIQYRGTGNVLKLDCLATSLTGEKFNILFPVGTMLLSGDPAKQSFIVREETVCQGGPVTPDPLNPGVKITVLRGPVPPEPLNPGVAITFHQAPDEKNPADRGPIMPEPLNPVNRGPIMPEPLNPATIKTLCTNFHLAPPGKGDFFSGHIIPVDMVDVNLTDSRTPGIRPIPGIPPVLDSFFDIFFKISLPGDQPRIGPDQLKVLNASQEIKPDDKSLENVWALMTQTAFWSSQGVSEDELKKRFNKDTASAKPDITPEEIAKITNGMLQGSELILKQAGLKK